MSRFSSLQSPLRVFPAAPPGAAMHVDVLVLSQKSLDSWPLTRLRRRHLRHVFATLLWAPGSLVDKGVPFWLNYLTPTYWRSPLLPPCPGAFPVCSAQEPPLGCLLRNLDRLGLAGDLRPNTSFSVVAPPGLIPVRHWLRMAGERHFGFSILTDLDNFCCHNGKWSEVPYIQVFFMLCSHPIVCQTCSPI